MRLLNTKTFKFKNFYDSDMPKYAVLSHRWGSEEEEVSYKQFRKGSVPPDLPGLLKIQAFCRLADQRGFLWAWDDTCCIDKRSSAEIFEAINSMFKWYRRSAECYVHLADVEFLDDELSLKRQSEEIFWGAPGGWASLKDRFDKSSWFERGWTLQELIAPDFIIFYDSLWNEIGSRDRIREDIAKVTGIDEYFLGVGSGLLHPPSVATRMSWVSRRRTSREEDIAYCLLGIFNINMPLLYGEGAEKAFIRLQTEIMKDSMDESLFAWTSDEETSGLLAKRPSYFANSGDILCPTPRKSRRPPYSITNQGLEIALPKEHLQLSQEDGIVRLFLLCSRRSETSDPHNSVSLKRPLYVELFMKKPPYACRINCATLKEISTYQIHHLGKDLADTERIYIDDEDSSFAEMVWLYADGDSERFSMQLYDHLAKTSHSNSCKDRSKAISFTSNFSSHLPLTHLELPAQVDRVSEFPPESGL